MHIPDGFLSTPWIVGTYTLTILYYALIEVWEKASLTPEKISLVTTLAAAIFVAQMLNWPIPGGTSLHFVGGGLAGLILGPWLGSITMALVIIVQAIVFHDGGITTLGANILNMGIVAVLIGYYTYKISVKLLSGRRGEKTVFIPAFLAGWMSVFIAGVVAGVEIGLSPRFPYGILVTVPVMGGFHFALGIIEGVITGLVISYIAMKNPDMLGIRGDAL